MNADELNQRLDDAWIFLDKDLSTDTLGDLATGQPVNPLIPTNALSQMFAMSLFELTFGSRGSGLWILKQGEVVQFYVENEVLKGAVLTGPYKKAHIVIERQHYTLL